MDQGHRRTVRLSIENGREEDETGNDDYEGVGDVGYIGGTSDVWARLGRHLDIPKLKGTYNREIYVARMIAEARSSPPSAGLRLPWLLIIASHFRGSHVA